MQPQRTILVDIAPEPEDILARMKSKTRYNVRLAERKGVTVREGTERDLDSFYDLMLTTAERDRFGVHSRAYYEAVYRLFVPQGIGRLLLAEYDGELIAGVMAFACGGKAWYMYGASGDAHRNRMPNYLLQWEAIQWARAQGSRTYDLWGVPDENEETLETHFLERHDGLWGVYRFKRGFGGRVVRYVGAWDYVYRPTLYWLYRRALSRRGQE
ncbi:MAG: peptidoglycan bridge formation glycyltransferase FemA/FemB family protein [Chloroflexota bacterium]|nr:peptidoglycan bridge formation glycyltransferase FemA/FemB family protein [Chloroflexota bacterium]